MEQPRAHFDFLSGTHEISTILSIGTALAANGVKDGQTYDVGNFSDPLPGLAAAGIDTVNAGHAGPAYFRAFANSDQAGTLVIQQSPDGLTWFQTDTVAYTAGATGGKYLESPVVLRYVRAVMTNGSTLQTTCEFDTVLVSR